MSRLLVGIGLVTLAAVVVCAEPLQAPAPRRIPVGAVPHCVSRDVDANHYAALFSWPGGRTAIFLFNCNGISTEDKATA